MTVAGMAGLRLRSRLDLSKVWPDFLVWLAVSVCTLGLGWLVVAGHFFRAVINSVELTDAGGAPVGRLVCRHDVESGNGQLLRWLLICIATLGVGLLFYSFAAGRAAMNHTESPVNNAKAIDILGFWVWHQYSRLQGCAAGPAETLQIDTPVEAGQAA